MPCQTELVCYSTASSLPNAETLPRRVGEVFGAEAVVAICAADSRETNVPPTYVDGPSVDADLFETVCAAADVREAAGFVDDHRTIFIMFDDWRRRLKLVTALSSRIAFEARGDFMPGEISLMVGPHYVCPRSGPLLQDIVPTRTCCSVSISGYGSPSHWPKYQESLLKVPEFLDIQTDLSAVIPQLRFGMVFVP